LIFGTYGIARGNGTDFEKEASEKIQDYYFAFVKYPVNGLPSLGWEAYEPGGEAVLLAYGSKTVQSIKESVLGRPCNGTTPNGLPLPPR
jgi:acetylcholinesterase